MMTARPLLSGAPAPRGGPPRGCGGWSPPPSSCSPPASQPPGVKSKAQAKQRDTQPRRNRVRYSGRALLRSLAHAQGAPARRRPCSAGPRRCCSAREGTPERVNRVATANAARSLAAAATSPAQRGAPAVVDSLGRVLDLKHLAVGAVRRRRKIIAAWAKRALSAPRTHAGARSYGAAVRSGCIAAMRCAQRLRVRRAGGCGGGAVAAPQLPRAACGTGAA
jgi:hypothetical protein